MRSFLSFILTPAATFLMGVSVAMLVESGASAFEPRSVDTPSSENARPLETEPVGYGTAFSTKDFSSEIPPRPTIEEFKELVTCNDRTIRLVWKQLTRTKDFWEWVHPSYENRDCSGMYEAFYLDLNNDGLKEIRIRGQYGNHCGATGNCWEWIFGFDRKSGKYRKILESGGEYFRIQKRKSKGYKNIYIATHDSASSSYQMIYQYDGRRYRESKCWFEEYLFDGTKNKMSCAEKNREYEE